MALQQVTRLSRTRAGLVIGAPREYAAFRSETAYGDASRAPDPQDVVAWLRWCKRERGMTR